MSKSYLSTVARCAEDALAYIGAPSVPHLVNALERGDSGLRAQSARALERIAPAAKDALPALREALKDKEAYVRQAAAEAIEKIQAASTQPAQTQPAGGGE